MKITKISIWNINLKSHETYYMAGNKTCDEVESVIISIDTDSGIQGWGECCPIPHYLPAYAKGIAPALTELAPIIIGSDPVGPEALMLKVNKYLQGHNYAKSPLDIALWDITAKVAKLPLFKLLGGQKQKDMPLYHSITCVAPDEMVKIAKEKQKEGITQFQVKLGVDNNWQVDAERLIKVREVIDDNHLVYGDWNCGATPLDAIRTSRKVAHLDIMLEQPCVTLSECASVKQATGLAMKLDEGVYDTITLLEGHEKGIMDVAALKLSKFGGVSAVRDARELCSYFGTKMCIEDTWGSDIATAALLHLGISCDPSRLLNVCDLSGYVSPRLDQNGPTRISGRISAPTGFGLGVEPDKDLLGKPDIILD